MRTSGWTGAWERTGDLPNHDKKLLNVVFNSNQGNLIPAFWCETAKLAFSSKHNSAHLPFTSTHIRKLQRCWNNMTDMMTGPNIPKKKKKAKFSIKKD